MRRRPIFRALQDIFQPGGGTIAGFVRLGVSTLLFGTFVQAWANLAGYLARWGTDRLLAGSGVLPAYTLVSDPRSECTRALVEFLAAASIFTLVFGSFYLRYRRFAKDKSGSEEPTPHKGLILLLSPFRPNPDPSIGPRDLAEISQLLSDPEALKTNLRETNWGTLAAAIDHHKSSLTHCWLVCSKNPGGSEHQFPTAEAAIQSLAGKTVICEKEAVDNAQEIHVIKPAIDCIYQHKVRKIGMGLSDVIADYTGGTAAMSGAMILATLDEQCDVEYLRQDTKTLMAVRTSRDLVADERK
jgi:hypothetical protein